MAVNLSIMTVRNTLAYYGTEKITAVKSFIVQDPESLSSRTGVKTIKKNKNPIFVLNYFDQNRNNLFQNFKKFESGKA